LNENATVGYWVSDSTPQKITALREIYFAFACMHDVNFFVFSQKDVNVNDGTINGLFWENGEYVRKVTAMPTVFDMRLGGNLDRKFPDVLNTLKQSSYQVSRRGIGDKNDVAKWLLKEKTFADYVIETQSYAQDSLKGFLAEHKTVILKPRSGSNGRGIYKLQQKSDDMVLVHYLADKTDENIDSFIAEKHDMFVDGKYMMQTFVNSTALDGSPMDIRLNLARGKDGQWGTSVAYFRFGGSSRVGTNMGKGQRARAVDVLNTCMYQLGDVEGRRVHTEFKNFAKTFPVHFQKKLRFLVPELAIDIGIDRDDNNKLKIFEVGISPGTTGGNMLAVPGMNMQFYKHLLTLKSEGKL